MPAYCSCRFELLICLLFVLGIDNSCDDADSEQLGSESVRRRGQQQFLRITSHHTASVGLLPLREHRVALMEANTLSLLYMLLVQHREQETIFDVHQSVAMLVCRCWLHVQRFKTEYSYSYFSVR